MKHGDAEKLKNWNFPKAHLHVHAFDDILAKGVLRSYTTKLFERLHRTLKVWFNLRTNFKNIEEQVSCFTNTNSKHFLTNYRFCVQKPGL